jgi:hypothetical protein
MQSDLNNVYIKNTLKFQSDLNLQIYRGTQDQLVMKANIATGALALNAGSGGIVIDSTIGNGVTGSQNGPISLISQFASSWDVSGADLGFSAVNITETTTTGDITKTAGGAMTLTANAGDLVINSANGPLDLTANANLNATANINMILTANNDMSLTASTGSVTIGAGTAMYLDSVGNTSIGVSTATDVIIGNSSYPVHINGNTTTINGNLIVNGTNTTINSTTILETDNLLVLNTNANGVPAGDGNDGGILIDRSASDIGNHNTTVITAGTTTGVITGSASGTTVNLANNTNRNTYYVKLTSGLLTGQTRLISNMDGTTDAATVTAWTPTALTGSNFAVSASGTQLIITGWVSEELSVGSNITISANDYVVESITGSGVYILNGVNTTDIPTAASATLIAPGAGVTYNIYDQTFVGMFWHESSQKFVYAGTKTAPGQGAVVIDEYLDVQMNNLTANTITSSSFSVSGTDAANWDGSALTAALLLTGGLGVEKNVIVRTDSATVTNYPMSLTQTNTSTGLDPTTGVGAVLALTQSDHTQAVLSVTGASAGNSTSTAGTLINTNAGDNNSLVTVLQGFMRVNVTDTGVSNPLNNGVAISYYSPLYSIV